MTVQNPHLVSKLLTAVESTADNIMITDRDGHIEYVNPAFEKNTGYSQKELIGQTPRILRSGRQDEKYYHQLWRSILQGKVFRSSVANQKKDGSIYYADQTISPVKDEQGVITHFISVWKDITEQIHYEKDLLTLNRRLKVERDKLDEILTFDENIARLRRLEDLVDFVVEKAAQILEAEQVTLMLLDSNAHELCIKGSKGLDERDIESVRVGMGEPVAGMVAHQGLPILVENIHSDQRIAGGHKEIYLTRSFVAAPIITNHQILGVVTVAKKISEDDVIFKDIDLKILCALVRQAAVAIDNAYLYKELKYLTITDPMTNIYNFRHFAKSLDYEIKRFNRYGGDLSLMMLDIDDFKSYNDEFGHVEGDVLLRNIGELLKQNMRETDVVCRYAGDEFAVILPQTPPSNARIAAEKVLDGIESRDFRKPVRVSIGVAKYVKGMTRYDLVLRADRALYDAKHAGKGRVQMYGCDEPKEGDSAKKH